MKKALAIILVSALVLMAAGGITAVTLLSQETQVTVTKISFSATKIDILVGDYAEIPLVVESGNIEDVRIVSSNSDILEITEDGRLYAKSTLGSNISKVYLTATTPEGEKVYLNDIYVYNDVTAYMDNLGDGLYVVYRVYNKEEDSWRIAGFTPFEVGFPISAPLVDPTPGYDMTGNWYSTQNMKASDIITFQGLVKNKSFAIYAEEFIRDGSTKVNGHIDLNVEYDSTYGYVVTGLKYDYLKYESITIPKTYEITKEDGTKEAVNLVGIADGAFERARKNDDGTLSNVGLQSLKKVDLSHIEYIGNNAFKNCLLLQTVVLNSGVCQTADTAFDGTPYKDGGLT